MERYKSDSESVYNTWFVYNDTRMKAFRSIRRGVLDVIAAIKEGTVKEENEHLRIQFLLTEIGRELGYDVFVASNDRSKTLDGKSLAFLTISELPPIEVLCLL